jgi:hypothetical protein
LWNAPPGARFTSIGAKGQFALPLEKARPLDVKPRRAYMRPQ